MEFLEQLSQELLQVTDRVSPWIVRVNGRRGPNASGLLWSADTVVTSHKALHRDSKIEVGLPTGETVLGSVKGRAPDLDFAILRLPEPVQDFNPPPWADEPTPGIVLALAREREGTLLTKFTLLPTARLEHRMSPAPEFLGGPLVDYKGRILGLHLMVGKPTVVTRERLQEVFGRVSDGSYLEPGFLGLGLHQVDLGERRGCLIMKLEGPASESELQLGDVLVSVDGQTVDDPTSVRDILRSKAAGTSVQLKFFRGGKTLTREVTLGHRPEPPVAQHFKKHMKKVMRHLRHHHHRHHPGERPPTEEDPEVC